MRYPLAIMDYGIGGLGFYSVVRKHHPQVPIVYFSDSGETPYGKLTAQALRARVEKVIHFLRGIGAERIVVACHSASSVVVDSDRDVISIRQSTIDSVLLKKPKAIGILGGGRTIESGWYRDELERKGVAVKQQEAQELSILVERGELDSKQVHVAVQRSLSGLTHCECILFACTHYPALQHVFRQYTGATMIDPVTRLFEEVDSSFTFHQGDRGITSLFLTTGDPGLMKVAASKAFHVDTGGVTTVAIA